MGNFAENLNLGNRFRPPLLKYYEVHFDLKQKSTIIFFMKFAQFEE